jgi:deoxyribonuclease IV
MLSALTQKATWSEDRMRIGRHMPTGSQPVRALRTARTMGCETVQVFVTNPRGWREPTTRPEEEEAFRTAATELGLAPLVVHATYLINLASPREDFFAQSVGLLRATLHRAARYGASYVVFHVGSRGGAGEAAGLARLAEGVRQVMEAAPAGVTLLLENDVGAGGSLGSRFENLAAILAAVEEYEKQLGICLDTAHLWGAGFDVGTPAGVEQTLGECDRLIGLGRVAVVHLNDTKYALGSHRDVHARIGEGIIGQEGLAGLLRHPGLAHAAVLLETPIMETASGQPDWTHEAAQVRRVKALAGREVPGESAPESDAAAPAGDSLDGASESPRPRARTRGPAVVAGAASPRPPRKRGAK